MTFEEFKKFLEKNYIDVNFKQCRNTGCLTGEFHLGDRILAIYEVKGVFHTIYQMDHDILLDFYLSLLAKKENLKDVCDAILSAVGDLEQDNYEICEVETNDGPRDTQMEKDDGMTINDLKEFLKNNNIRLKFRICDLPNSIECLYLLQGVRLLASQVYVKPIIDLSSPVNINDINTLYFDTLQKENGISDVYDWLIGKLNGKETSIREETLDTAKKCVMGDREQDYGTPESNFATIASFWSDYLDKDISAQQVADMMILMKISRIKNGGGTGDSYVDIAGYAACGNEILSKRA